MHRIRRHLLVLVASIVAVAALGVNAGAAVAHDGDHGHHDHRHLRITAFNYGYRGVPRELDAGHLTFSFHNSSPDEDHEIGFYRLNNPRTSARAVRDQIAEIIATTPPGQPPDPGRITLFDLNSYQGTEAAPGQSTTGNRLDLQKGSYVYLCFMPSPGHNMEPHVLLGMIGKVRVEE